MYKKGQTTGSNAANRALVARYPLVFERSLNKAEDELLYDPQTSGGLLLSLPTIQIPKLLADLHANGVAGVKIGEVVEGTVGLTVS